MSETINTAKGRIKQAVGGLIGDQKLKKEGEKDEIKGQLEGAAKEVQHAVKGAKDALKQALK